MRRYPLVRCPSSRFRINCGTATWLAGGIRCQGYGVSATAVKVVRCGARAVRVRAFVCAVCLSVWLSACVCVCVCVCVDHLCLRRPVDARARVRICAVGRSWRARGGQPDGWGRGDPTRVGGHAEDVLMPASCVDASRKARAEALLAPAGMRTLWCFMPHASGRPASR